MDGRVKQAIRRIQNVNARFPAERFVWFVLPEGYVRGQSANIRSMLFSGAANVAPPKIRLWLRKIPGGPPDVSSLPMPFPRVALVAGPDSVLLADAPDRLAVQIMDGYPSAVCVFSPDGATSRQGEDFTRPTLAGEGVSRLAPTDYWHARSVLAWLNAGGSILREPDDPDYLPYSVGSGILAFARACMLAATGAVAHQPSPQRSAVRASRTAKPTYEWRTVVIEPRKPRTEPKGGTHASPRQHDRRGHWSTSRLGKRYWRPPCKVGKAKDGFVFHDYVVKGA